MVEFKIVKEEPEEKNSKEDLIKIVNAWKMLKGLPMEGQDSKNWNKVHYPRHMKCAKELLLLFGSWENAVDCIQMVFEMLESSGRTFTIETIIKHSDIYREKRRT